MSTETRILLSAAIASHVENEYGSLTMPAHYVVVIGLESMDQPSGGSTEIMLEYSARTPSYAAVGLLQGAMSMFNASIADTNGED